MATIEIPATPLTETLTQPSSTGQGARIMATQYPNISPHLLLTSVDHELIARGRCTDGAGTFAFLFFSEELHEIAQAKAICSHCDVSDRCLSGALVRREPWGVWGGELIMNGKILAAKRRRGRPPKVRQFEDEIDELGRVISA